MEITVSIEQGQRPISVIHPDGNIDSGTYEKFESSVEEVIKAGARDILIDLTNVQFVSSAGIRAIHAIFNKLRSLSPDVSDEEMHMGINAGTYKSKHLKLLNPSKETLKNLNLTGLDMYIEIFTDLRKAISSF